MCNSWPISRKKVVLFCYLTNREKKCVVVKTEEDNVWCVKYCNEKIIKYSEDKKNGNPTDHICLNNSILSFLLRGFHWFAATSCDWLQVWKKREGNPKCIKLYTTIHGIMSPKGLQL